jgi:hypothetical protein
MMFELLNTMSGRYGNTLKDLAVKIELPEQGERCYLRKAF